MGQIPYYDANGSALTATSSVTILQNGDVGIGTTTPGVLLGVQGSGVFAGNLTAQTITASSSVVSPSFNATGALELNGANINTGGTLSDVAYLSQSQTFTGLDQFDGNASSTAFSANTAYFGSAAASSFSSTGVLTLASALGEFGRRRHRHFYRWRDQRRRILQWHRAHEWHWARLLGRERWDRHHLSLRGALSLDFDAKLSGSTLFAIVNSAGSTILDVLGNGNVGINNTSPSSTLTLNGTSLFQNATTAPEFGRRYSAVRLCDRKLGR